VATAKKTPSGKWRCLAYVGKGVTKSGYKSFTADTKREAEALAAMYTEETARPEKLKLTVGQAIDQYIDTKDSILSPATIRGYRKIRRVDMQGIMGISVRNLTNDDIQAEFNAEARTKSPKTLRNALALLTSSLRHCRKDFHVDISLPQKQKADIHIPTLQEINALADASNENARLAILLGAMLGLRRSEVCGLTFSDFDRTAGTLSITKAMVLDDQKEWVIKPPKSVAGYRKLPLPSVLLDLISCKDGEPNEQIVKLNPNKITYHFERAQLKCFGKIRYRFHDLRHYNASVMLALNVPNKYAMERMGHATDNMLKAVYQHVMQDKQKEISDQISAFFNQNTTR
jgi:integrase